VHGWNGVQDQIGLEVWIQCRLGAAKKLHIYRKFRREISTGEAFSEAKDALDSHNYSQQKRVVGAQAFFILANMEWMALSELPDTGENRCLESTGICVRKDGRWMAMPSGGDDTVNPSEHTAEESRLALPFHNWPVLDVQSEELGKRETWEFLLRFVRRNIPALARFTRDEGLAPDGLIQALGWKAHYRTREEWAQWAELDAISEKLFLIYDFPLNTLRLWDRLGDDDRTAWMELWQSRGLKKNLVREIIQYYHDLSAEARKSALERCQEFSENWKARSGNFPGEQLRDILYSMRYPEISDLQNQVFQLQKRLPTHKKMQFLVPDHLEAGFLDVRLRIESGADVEELARELLKTTEEGNLEQLLALIR